MAPASVHDPEEIQFPQGVVPSSFSQAKPGTCWPALMVVFVFGSVMSASALPLSSFATSASDGLYGLVYANDAFKTGSGNLPPSFLYSSRVFKKMVARISWSSRACPGGGTATFFHWSQRAEFTKVPSFSAKPAPGNRYTVVLIFFCSSAVMPGARQNSLVSSG